jgi:hypothetical protein
MLCCLMLGWFYEVTLERDASVGRIVLKLIIISLYFHVMQSHAALLVYRDHRNIFYGHR